MLDWYSPAFYRAWMAYHNGHILAKQVAYFKALGRDTSIFSYYRSERTCGNKRQKKGLFTTYVEDGT